MSKINQIKPLIISSRSYFTGNQRYLFQRRIYQTSQNLSIDTFQTYILFWPLGNLYSNADNYYDDDDYNYYDHDDKDNDDDYDDDV